MFLIGSLGPTHRAGWMTMTRSANVVIGFPKRRSVLAREANHSYAPHSFEFLTRNFDFSSFMRSFSLLAFTRFSLRVVSQHRCAFDLPNFVNAICLIHLSVVNVSFYVLMCLARIDAGGISGWHFAARRLGAFRGESS